MSRTFKRGYGKGGYWWQNVTFKQGYRSMHVIHHQDADSEARKWYYWGIANRYHRTTIEDELQDVLNKRKHYDKSMVHRHRTDKVSGLTKEHSRIERRNNEKKDLHRIVKDIESYDEKPFRDDHELRYISWMYD